MRWRWLSTCWWPIRYFASYSGEAGALPRQQLRFSARSSPMASIFTGRQRGSPAGLSSSRSALNGWKGVSELSDWSLLESGCCWPGGRESQRANLSKPLKRARDSLRAMGRIKTALIKRVSKKLVVKFGDKFATDVEQNKRVLSEVVIIYSKKLRNVIAGYVSRLMKQRAQAAV